jgi:hypothetical protein
VNFLARGLSMSRRPGKAGTLGSATLRAC